MTTVYAFDLDGTLCHTPNGNDYKHSIPIHDRIAKVNQLHLNGDQIIIYTARGCRSGLTPKLEDLTAQQLKNWGVSYDKLIMGQKIFYDILVDDKAMSVDQWEREVEIGKLGIIAGSFDVIHPGYITMFDNAKTICSRLLVALQEQGKRRPVLSVEERKSILLSLKQVDKVVTYKTEKDLYNVLKFNCPHVRILGDDYVGKKYTGVELKQPVHFIDRSHGWSTTGFLKKIKGQQS